jgi:hypothetical protein
MQRTGIRTTTSLTAQHVLGQQGEQPVRSELLQRALWDTQDAAAQANAQIQDRPLAELRQH